MDWSAHNAGFVEAAYAVTAICIIGLVIWVLQRDKSRARQLKNSKD